MRKIEVKEHPDGWALYDNQGLVAIGHRGYQEAALMARLLEAEQWAPVDDSSEWSGCCV